MKLPDEPVSKQQALHFAAAKNLDVPDYQASWADAEKHGTI